MVSIDELLSQLRSEDAETASEAMSSLCELGVGIAVPPILEILRDHSDPRLRMQAALCIRDIKALEGLPVLVEALRDPKNSSYRGTFVYAMQPFDCRPYVAEIARLVGDEVFEVREMALQLMEEMNLSLELASIQDARQILTERLQECSSDPEVSPYVTHAFKILNALESNEPRPERGAGVFD